mmetsp:Transcript_1162/g.1849  ORF Transcript_1162/g.1849 Transcript_1162/m.1849 type:complete len:313 (-) Transcript_1162:6-944(-)
MGLQVNIISPGLISNQIRQRLRILLGRSLHTEGLQSLHGDDPRRNSSSKVLSTEGTQRNILPLLDVTSAPIIHDSNTKNFVFSIFDLNSVAQLIRGTDVESHLKLEIKESAGSELRGSLSRLGLTAGTMEVGSRNNNRGGSAMVTNREMEPVGLKGVINSTEHDSHIGGVLSRRVKISIISNTSRENHLNRILCHKGFSSQFLVISQSRIISRQERRDGNTSFLPGSLAHGHEGVEGGLTEDFGAIEERSVEQASIGHNSKIQDLISNSNSNGVCPILVKDTIRKILNREVAVGFDLDERLRNSSHSDVGEK